MHVIRDSPAVGTDTVYASNQGDGVLYAFSRTDGSIRWTASVHTFQPAVLANGVIYTVGNGVQMTDAGTGANVGRSPQRSPFSSSSPTRIPLASRTSTASA